MSFLALLAAVARLEIRRTLPSAFLQRTFGRTARITPFRCAHRQISHSSGVMGALMVDNVALRLLEPVPERCKLADPVDVYAQPFADLGEHEADFSAEIVGRCVEKAYNSRQYILVATFDVFVKDGEKCMCRVSSNAIFDPGEEVCRCCEGTKCYPLPYFWVRSRRIMECLAV